MVTDSKNILGTIGNRRETPHGYCPAAPGLRSPATSYPTPPPPLSAMGEPECSMRELVEPISGAKAGDRVRYVQFVDSMYNAPATPYFRTYNAAINHRGVDPGTLSGRQVNECRERNMEEVAKAQMESEMSCPALTSLRGATVHGHSLRLQEDGVMFDMLDRSRLENGVMVMTKDQVAIPIDRKINLGKPMSSEEAAKRTTIYRVDNVAFKDDPEVIEWVHRVWELRTRYGYQPK